MSDITNDDNIKAWADKSSYVTEKFTDDGDFYRKHVINPAIFSLLGDIKGKTILDAGSGQGYLSRLLAKQGAIVTSLEPAEGLIAYAIERERTEKLGITHIKADLSTWNEKPSNFDIVVSNMVFMDIPDWKSAIENCVTSLKKGGIFVFSISHPCFDQEEGRSDKPYAEIKNYFNEYSIQNYIGYSFHHMLSDYINLVINYGCTIKRIMEPQLPKEFSEKNDLYARDKNVPNFLLVKATKE